jgi:mono/diheme cytochrome c family protein
MTGLFLVLAYIIVRGIRALPAGRLFALCVPSFLLIGCYAFVHDEDPPEWTPDPKDVAAQQTNPSASGSDGPGASVFNAKCAVCHQMTGKGIPGVYPPLAGSEMATGNPERPVRIVLHGFNGPIVRNGASFNGVMQPWQNDLSDQQIADVLSYVRSSWGNSAPAVDAAAVKKIRDLTKNKAGAFNEAELKNLK